LIEDICTHNDEELRAYCYCCPALRLDEYHSLYVPPIDSSTLEVVSSKGKMAQDIFRECVLCKNRGSGIVLHTNEELHEFFVKVAVAATAHINYSKMDVHSAEAWLRDMPSDEEAGWGVTVLTGKTPDSAVMTTRARM
jgi:hypothetical protein